ncbi:branched-chain amino acid ABC transporter permease [Thalassospira sp. SM2505]|uniref:Branched-chain amino acid ABC transporter permease n=1 Tax=Thalassospira profundimaris TaxID=502049 RepID=A0A367WQQ5_9PROT|nr:branched-chain amino acid ABC transporter permease [Thalassospira profundimaris]RCK43718.1 branched-chain amino acid ABC transporter permease [Thalassospira profundimaris]
MLSYAIFSGITLGGMYALVAMGLTLQYGVSRIMNLAYGELVIVASFIAFVFMTSFGINPILGLLIIIPLSFVLNWAIYRILLTPLVARAKNRGMLEVDSILATFGLLFIVQGVLLVWFGGNYYSYDFMNNAVDVFGAVIAANRLVALGFAVVIGLGFYLILTRTRIGTALRAVAVDPTSARLVAIDVNFASCFAFALGGAVAAVGGVLVSMFLTFSTSMGVVFTMKALIVVIMGGVGNLLGALVAGLILGVAESLVATYIDPGLTIAVTYVIFLLVLLVKPSGLFGRATS